MGVRCKVGISGASRRVGGQSVVQVNGSATPGFSPLSLSPIVWLTGSPASYFTDLGKTTPAGLGSQIQVWADVSGNGRDFTQTNASKRPVVVNVSGVLLPQFDGSDDYLFNSSVPGLADNETWCVADCDFNVGTGTFDSAVWGREQTLAGADARFSVHFQGAPHRLSATSYSPPSLGLANFSPTTVAALTRVMFHTRLTYDGVNQTIAFDTATRATTTNSTAFTLGEGTGQLCVGYGNETQPVYHAGRIQEFIRVPAPVSGVNQAKMAAYLAAKWGLLN